MNIPAIDHSLLSPSGRMSKRAREAALRREAARLFPLGTFSRPEPTAAEQAQVKAQMLLRSAANLRDLAARGMSVRKFIKQAERLEAEAAALTAAEQGASHG